jgi:predicted double-glycine peptidase
MKNLLSLHEAIVVALINIDKETFTASFLDIARYIDKRGLFAERKGGIDLAEQVKLRSTLSSRQYDYLFYQIDDTHIQLRKHS